MLRVLCVCTGNTCRSPMLGALLKRELSQRGVAAVVESAGTAAVDGDEASPHAIVVMERRGIDLRSHRSRAIDGLKLENFDRILVVTSRHAAFIRSRGVPAERIAVVGAEQGGIPDPWGGSEADYEACAIVLEAEAQRIGEGFKDLPHTG